MEGTRWKESLIYCSHFRAKKQVTCYQIRGTICDAQGPNLGTPKSEGPKFAGWLPDTWHAHMYAGAYYDIYIYIQKGTPPGPTKYMSRNLCYTRHKVNDLSLIIFFLVEIFFYLVFFGSGSVHLVRRGGQQETIYIFIYFFLLPPQTFFLLPPPDCE